MLTVKELQEWEHYEEFIKLRLEECSYTTIKEFLERVEKGKYEDLSHVVIVTAEFSIMPKWKKIWEELIYEQA